MQKRVGARCRNLKKQYTIAKTKLAAQNGIGGTAGLKDAVINRLQNYFGLAIRSYNSSINEMKKAIGDVLYHCSEGTDSASRLRFCPRNEKTWCKYWQAYIGGTLATYIESKGIPVAIRSILRPIFDDFAKDELVTKCLHGATQNNNEALNSLIWKKVPKDVFVWRDTLEIDVCSAVIHFNHGLHGMKNLYLSLNMKTGTYFSNFCFESDTNRIIAMKGKSSTATKLRRKYLRAVRKKYIDTHKEVEGETYDLGTLGDFCL